jgi:aryl-phospho-beta-D-glucosidase BglC (GH1 family)
MGLFNKFKSSVQETFRTDLPDRHFPPASQVLPLEHSLVRYRKQRGLNLGGWFVTEGWLNLAIYNEIAVEPKGSDFDLARSGNRAAMERHWDTWVTEDDWKWMKDRGFNSVRLPVSDLI